jgi:hypothetical protein
MLRNFSVKWNFMPMYKGDTDFTPSKMLRIPVKLFAFVFILGVLAFAFPFAENNFSGKQATELFYNEITLPVKNYDIQSASLAEGFHLSGKNGIPGLAASVFLLLLLAGSGLWLMKGRNKKAGVAGKNSLARRKFIQTGLVFTLGAGIVGIRKAGAIDSNDALPDFAVIPTNLAKEGLNAPNAYSTRYLVTMDNEGDKPTVNITGLSDNLTYDVTNVQATGNPKEFTFDLNLYTGSNISSENLELEVKREIPDGINRFPVLEDMKIDYNALDGSLRFNLDSSEDYIVELIDNAGRTRIISSDRGYEGMNTVGGLNGIMAGLPTAQYHIRVRTDEGFNQLNFIPGQSATNKSLSDMYKSSGFTKSGQLDSLEEALINVDTQGLTTRKLGDHYTRYGFAGGKLFVYLVNEVPDDYSKQFELVGMSDNIKDWGYIIDEDDNQIRGPPSFTPEQSRQRVYFDIKAPDDANPASGLTQRITHWLSRYDVDFELQYDDNGEGKALNLKLPDYIAGMLMQHEDAEKWNPENVQFREYTGRDRVGNIESFEAIMNKLYDIMTKPEFAEQKAWLKNANTDYEQIDGEWVNKWYETEDLLTKLSEDPMDQDELIPDLVKFEMKDYAS